MEVARHNSSDPIYVASHEVHVWTVPLDGFSNWEERSSVLAKDELKRAETIRFEHIRRRFIVSRTALRTVLGSYLELPPHEVQIAYAAQGKPRLASFHEYSNSEAQQAGARAPSRSDDRPPTGTSDHHSLFFNLAHSGELAMVAVARECEVGIDVEQLRPVHHVEQLAQRYFHPAEAAAVRAAAPESRSTTFLRFWTQKEAVLKAIGSGVQYPLQAFQVQLGDLTGAWVDVPTAVNFAAARCWVSIVDALDDYVAAVACVGLKCPVTHFELD